MALPTKQMLEDPKFQRRLVDSLLGYPRRWWQHPLCWVGIRRRVPRADFSRMIPGKLAGQSDPALGPMWTACSITTTQGEK